MSHIAEHGVTPEEVDAILRARIHAKRRSRSNPEHWLVDGLTPAGRLLRVVFDWVDEFAIAIPITAFEPEPKGDHDE